MADTLLTIRNLTIDATAYPPGEPPQEINIVKGVDLTLERGKVLGLIGESGAGKSTIGLSPAGYGRGGIRLDGEVWVNGRNILDGSPKALRQLRGKEVCYVAQSAAAAFNPAHTLMEQVIETTLLHGPASRKEAEARAVELFRQLGLPDPEHFGSRYPHQVSGGQLQRAMTAMALCPEPDLIIFDEPTTALDVTTQIDVLAAIKHAISKTGVGALYITHDLAVVAQVADDIMVLRHGAMVEYGPTRQIIEAPQEPYTQCAGLGALHRSCRQDAGRNAGSGHRAGQRRLQQQRRQRASRGQHGSQPRPDAGHRGGVRVGQIDLGSGDHRPAAAQPGAGQLPVPGPAQHPGERGKETLRELQMIYQMADVAMNPRHTVETIIGRPLTFYFGLKGKARRQRVIELLDEIELGESFIDRYPAELSGGRNSGSVLPAPWRPSPS